LFVVWIHIFWDRNWEEIVDICDWWFVEIYRQVQTQNRETEDVDIELAEQKAQLDEIEELVGRWLQFLLETVSTDQRWKYLQIQYVNSRGYQRFLNKL